MIGYAYYAQLHLLGRPNCRVCLVLLGRPMCFVRRHYVDIGRNLQVMAAVFRDGRSEVRQQVNGMGIRRGRSAEAAYEPFRGVVEG